MVIIDAERVASGRADNTAWLKGEAVRPHQTRRLPAAVAPSPTPAANRNPHSHRLWPTGSFLGDFRKPAGARNSSRQRTGGSKAAESES